MKYRWVKKNYLPNILTDDWWITSTITYDICLGLADEY
jgi:hypothetical protein